MMKQQPSVHKKYPSRFCKGLFLILSMKIGFLLFFALDLSLPFFPQHEPLGSSPVALTSIAIAASPPGAPPAIPPSPASGAEVPQPPSSSTPPSSAANTDIQNQLTQPKALPPITTNSSSRDANIAADALTRDMLTKKQEDLQRKEQELKALEAQLNDKLSKMAALENRLNIMMQEADAKDAEKTKHLVDVLTNMKSKAAAQVLETMDPRIAVKVLAQMAGRQAGEILTFMQPATAASLGTALTRMQMPLP